MSLIKTKTNTLTFSSITGNKGLNKALAMHRPDVIAEISASGLKGRGGAGFPTSVKWNLAAAARSDKKYVICNADEGEPGTFKDRVILSEFPDLVLEGMTIAAYAIGAAEGIIYLRAEYSYLRELLEATLAKREQDGFLGNDILGKDGFSFKIVIRMGAGAYICGEETALIESLEGAADEFGADGTIALSELRRYLEARVAELTRGRQTPYAPAVSELNEDPVLFHLPSR